MYTIHCLCVCVCVCRERETSCRYTCTYRFEWQGFRLIHRFFNTGLLGYYTGEGNGSPLQSSGLGNPGDRGAWWAAVHKVAQSRERLKRLSCSSRVLNDLVIQGWLNPQVGKLQIRRADSKVTDRFSTEWWVSP